MTQMGRLIVLAGACLVFVGAVVWVLGRAGFRSLPGDIRYDSDRVKIYFPIATCMVLSAVLTGLLWVISYFRDRFH